MVHSYSLEIQTKYLLQQFPRKFKISCVMVGLGWVGLGWVGLVQIGLDWVGLGWAGLLG